MAVRDFLITFARGAQAWTPQITNSTASGQLTQVPIIIDLGTDRKGYWTGPLPDLVLGPQGQVNLRVARGGSANNALKLHDLALAYTPLQPSDASQVVLSDQQPLFIPIPNDAVQP